MKRLEDLTPDPNNANEGSHRGASMLGHSLEQFGACRSIVATEDGVVFIGSHTLDAAIDRGLRPRFVETDGSELVVVVRKDLKYDDPRVAAAAIADNRSRDTSAVGWNPVTLTALARERQVSLGDFFYGTELADIAARAMRDRRDPHPGIKSPKPSPPSCPACGRPFARTKPRRKRKRAK